MINGAHAILYSKDSEKDRAFLKDILGLPHVDVGGGWLIFGLPPSEVAVHPSEKGGTHELYFMCADIVAFKKALAKKRIATSEVRELGWGKLCQVTLPGGGEIGVYEPLHARPKAPGSKPTRTKARKKSTTKRVAKPSRKKARRKR